NDEDGTISFDGSGSLNIPFDGGIVNSGMMTKVGAGSQATISGSGELSNFLGFVLVEAGTLNITCSLNDLRNGELISGSWSAAPGSQLLLPGPITKLGL